MEHNPSRLFRAILLVLGGAGLFVVGFLVSCMMPMMGMMGMDDKKAQGMMDQEHMKDMMQQMMGGMLPPGIRPQDLPEPESQGASPERLLRSMSQPAQPTHAYRNRLVSRGWPDADSGADDGPNARHDDASESTNTAG